MAVVAAMMVEVLCCDVGCGSSVVVFYYGSIPQEVGRAVHCVAVERLIGQSFLEEGGCE